MRMLYDFWHARSPEQDDWSEVRQADVAYWLCVCMAAAAAGASAMCFAIGWGYV